MTAVVMFGGSAFALIATGANPAEASGLGVLDQSFGSSNPTNGIATTSTTGNAQSIALDPSASDALGNYLLAAGTAGSSMGVARFTPEGAVDSSFGTSGVSSAFNPDTAKALAVAATTTHVYAVGYDQPTSTTYEPALAVFPAGGAAATAIDASTVPLMQTNFQNQFSAVAIDGADGGDVVVAGTVVVTGAAGTEVVVARYSPTGTLDPTFGTSGYYVASFSQNGTAGGDSVGGVVVDNSTGDIYIAGSTPPSSSCSAELYLARLTPVGTIDPTFNGGTNPELYTPAGSCVNTVANAIVLGSASAPAIVVGGTEYAPGQTSGSGLLVAFNATGGLDSSFGTSGVVTTSNSTSLDTVNSLAYVPTSPTDPTPSNLVVAGHATTTSNQVTSQMIAVARFSTAGVLDTANFGTSGTSEPLTCTGDVNCGTGVVVQPDASIDIDGGVPSAGSGGLTVAQLVEREVSVGDVASSVQVGSSDTTANFPITYNGPTLSGLTVKVTYQTVAGTAVDGTNFTGINGQVSFPCTSSSGAVTCSSNQLSATIAVPVLPSTASGGSLTFSLALSAPQNAGIGTSSGVATLVYQSTVVTTTTVAQSDNTTPTNPTVVTTTTTPGHSSTTTTLPSSGSTKKSSGKSPTTKAPVAGKGYWVVSSNGTVTALGDAPKLGSVASSKLSGSIVGIAPTSNGLGYWLVSTNGTVYAFGNARNYGSVAKAKPSGTVRGIVALSNGRGYWLATSTGAVYAYGAAHNYGSVGAKSLAGTIVGLSSLPSGTGYWMLSSKGNVYSFGAAKNYGSVPPAKVVGSMSAIIRTSTGQGYWAVSTRGTAYAFGNAHNYGSVPAKSLAGSAIALAVTPDNHGYWIAMTTGSVVSIGDAKTYGSATGHGTAAGVAAT